MLLAVSVLLLGGGCGSSSTSADQTGTGDSVRVVLSIPSDRDGTNPSSNSWSALARRISDDTKKDAGTRARLTLSQNRSLHDQATYLRSLAAASRTYSGASRTERDTTDDDVPALTSRDVLLFAPAVKRTVSSLFSPLASPASASSSVLCPAGSDTSDDDTGTAGQTDRQKQHQKALRRQAQNAVDAAGDKDCAQIAADTRTISSALSTLRKNRIRVVFIGSGIGTTAPDALLRTASARQIGHKEATNLVQKLDLTQATKKNPRAVLILLPSDEDTQDGLTTASSSAGAQKTTATSTGRGLTPTAREYLTGVLEVLAPYFKSGVAYNAYDISLTSAGSDEWADLVVPTDSDDASDRVQDIFDTCRRQILDASQSNSSDGNSPLSQDRLLGRLSHAVLGTGDSFPLSGVLAGNDALASLVVSELSSRGYTGSASDINPQVELGTILGTIGHSPDLAKKRVPDPASQSGGMDTASASAWPIVVGFGGSSDSAPSVANGRQWATGVVDEKDLATKAVRLIRNAGTGSSLTKGLATTQQPMGSATKSRTISATSYTTVFIDESNLKAVLVDGGYISAADAGI